MKTVVCLGIWLACQSAVAQTRIPVEVSYSGDDHVGGQVAYELREVIRGSNGMRLVNSSVDPIIRINLITTFVTSTEPSASSAVAAVYVYDSVEMPKLGALLTATVHVCGRNRAKECARSIVATADQEIVKLQQKSPALWKTLNRP